MSEERPLNTSRREGADASGDEPGMPHENEPPLGRAFFRVMRAIMFDEAPHPELDTLPLAQLRLLWTVYFQADATMKDFSERLGVSQSTVTQLADRLVRRGLVERQTDPADRRVVRLHVSEVGHQVLTESNTRQRQTFQEVWDSISVENRVVAMRGLDILGDAAEAMRVERTRDVARFAGRDAEADRPPAQNSDTSQTVVDLMARRVRGRKTR